jgi:hypothetical protein
MFSTLISLVVLLTPQPKVALDDLATYDKIDREYIKYLIVPDESDSDDTLAVVSFTLNSISNKKKIVLPSFVNKEKTLIRFDIRNYGFTNKAYEKIGNDPYTKDNKELKDETKTSNPLMRADYFVIKAWIAPLYYDLLDISNLQEFRDRYGYPEEETGIQAAVVVNGNLVRTTRYMKRIPTVNGAMWEARESDTIGSYLNDLLVDKYDSIEVIAANPNGLMAYYAGDFRGKPYTYLNPKLAVDHMQSFAPDLMVRVGRNCVVCHSKGVVPFEDSVRKLLKNKNIDLFVTEKKKVDKILELFGKELPISEDQDIYKEAVFNATGIRHSDFTSKFIAVWKKYYEPLNLKQVAKEIGEDVKDFKKTCELSDNPFLLSLLLYDKISRANLEIVLQGK